MTDARAYSQSIEVARDAANPTADAYSQSVEVARDNPNPAAKAYSQSIEAARSAIAPAAEAYSQSIEVARSTSPAAQVWMQAIEVMVSDVPARAFMQAIEVMIAVPPPPAPPPSPALVVVISQFANSPTLLQIVRDMDAWINPQANFDAFYSLIWNVDTAVGYGLDVWGRIVGVGRVLLIESGSFLGFEGPSAASGDPFNISPFFHGGTITSNFTLTDDVYRALILAKALYNICDGSTPAINQIVLNIFGPGGILPVAGNSYVTDDGNMTMTYTFGAALDPVQTAIVEQSGVLPKPVGVNATVVTP